MARLLIACFLSLHASILCAHDIGITEVILQEFAHYQYQLHVENPGNSQDAISAPELPSGCNYIKTGDAEDTRSLYFFKCTKPLGSGDSIILPWRTELVMVTALWMDIGEKRATFVRNNEVINIELASLSASSGVWQDIAARYLVLGVEHILMGVDHLLFVLGILLLAVNIRALVFSITAFTLAHSLSLALAFLGWVSLNSAPVEAAIALSIVVLAIEILRGQSGKPGFTWHYPWIICGGFGLLHGLGFAGALADINVPPKEISLALLFFNVGVEIGQLLFVAAILACCYGWLYLRKNLGWQFGSVGTLKTAAAYIIGSLASFWVLERSAVIFLDGFSS